MSSASAPSADAENHVTLGEVGPVEDVVHSEEEASASLKEVNFSDGHDFKRVLKKHDLPQFPERVTPAESQCERFVWANEDVLIMTQCHPKTGEHGVPAARQKDEGWASYVAISGRADAVKAVYETVLSEMESFGGADPSGRMFF